MRVYDRHRPGEGANGGGVGSDGDHLRQAHLTPTVAGTAKSAYIFATSGSFRFAIG